MAASGPVPEELSIESAHVKTHRSAQGSKGERGRRRLARRLAEEQAKAIVWADDRGRPVAIVLSPGNVADITMAIPLLEAVRPARRLLADKAYDAASLRQWLAGPKSRW